MAGRTAPDARAASALLKPVLDNLDSIIEGGAPGYQRYMTRFSMLSRPIDAMRWLQDTNMTDARGFPTLQKVHSAIEAIEDERMKPGIQAAKSFSPDQLDALNSLRDDLRRGANLAKGKALGSDTVQNLATSKTMNVLTSPIPRIAGRAAGAHFGALPGYLAERGVENLLTGPAEGVEAKVRQAVIDRLLNKNGLGVRALQQP